MGGGKGEVWADAATEKEDDDAGDAEIERNGFFLTIYIIL